MAQGRIPRMYHADGDNTGAGPVAIGATVPTSPDNKWHPTVLMLLGILVIEIAAFAGLRYAFGKL